MLSFPLKSDFIPEDSFIFSAALPCRNFTDFTFFVGGGPISGNEWRFIVLLSFPFVEECSNEDKLDGVGYKVDVFEFRVLEKFVLSI